MDILEKKIDRLRRKCVRRDELRNKLINLLDRAIEEDLIQVKIGDKLYLDLDISNDWDGITITFDMGDYFTLTDPDDM